MKSLTLIILLFFYLFSFSQATFTSVRSGTWSDNNAATTPWTISGTDSDNIPDSNDDVVINGTDNISLTGAAVVKSITINSNATLTTNSNTFSVYGDVTINGFVSGNFRLYVNANCNFNSANIFTNAGNWEITSGAIFNIGASTVISKANIINISGTNTTVNNYGSVSCNIYLWTSTSRWNNKSGSSLTVNVNIRGAGILDVSEVPNSCSYSGSSVNSIFNPSSSYYNLSLSGFSSKTTSSNLNVSNNLAITSGTLSIGSNNLTVSGNLTFSGGTVSNPSTLTQTSGTVSVSGTSTCSGTSAITVGTLNQTGNFTVSSGTLNLGSAICNLFGNLSNSGTISSTGTLNIAGALTFSGSGNLASNNTSTIVMNGSTAQTITIPAATTVPFNNFTCSNSNGVSFSGGNLNINNNLILTSGNLSLGNRSINIRGNISASGTGNLASGPGETNTIILNGTSAQTISNTTSSALNVYNLTCNNNSAAITLSSGNININNNLTVTSGILDIGSSSVTVIGNLTNSGTISSSGTLNIAGDLTFSGSGNLASNNTSTIIMNGSSNQTITNSTSSNIPFYNLTTSNSGQVSLSVTSTGRFTLKNILTVSSGTFSAGSDILTLLSDASSTAVIGNSPGTISGTIIMQRFIPSYSGLSSGYKFLASPASSVSISDWDEELLMSIGRADDGSNPAYLGGDGNSGGSPSVYFLNSINKAWTSVSVSSNQTLVAGRGYMVIVADTRTGTRPSFQYSFPGRAVDTRGNPNNNSSYTLNVNIAGTSLNAANNLLGNPYQSHLDWSIVRSNSSNIEASYYKFNNGNLVPSTDPIAPGQGFVVKATSSTGTVVISQSAKTTSTSSSTFVKINEGKKYDLQLRLSSAVNPFLHEIDLVFDKKSSVNFDIDKDASFIRSFIDEAPSIRLIDDNENELVLNYFSSEKNEVVFPLSIETPISGNYEINLDGLTTNGEYHSGFLINNNTGEKIDLAKSFSAYFDNSNLHSNYSLMLSKEKIINENLITSEFNNISSYTTSDYIVLKNNYDEIKRVSFKLINLLGQTLYEQSEYINAKDEYKIPIHNLKSDVYVIQINADQRFFSKKIVITK